MIIAFRRDLDSFFIRHIANLCYVHIAWCIRIKILSMYFGKGAPLLM